jgi:crotonobetainyl-CoA:carnitine CoA-transferase CaiB-like acyl-CoA transferase
MMGGMFAAIGILAALHQRKATGQGQLVRSALFENCAYLVSPHMAQVAVTGQAPDPMPNRISAWGIYDVFDTMDGEQVFIAVVSDTQWRSFCAAFDRPGLLADTSLATNPLRVAGRDRLIPILRELFRGYTRTEASDICDKASLGFAPITKPHELFDDPHLNRPGSMLEVSMPDGGTTRLPGLPLEMDGRRLPRRLDVPRLGEHSAAIAAEIGCDAATIEELIAEGVLDVAESAAAKRTAAE